MAETFPGIIQEIFEVAGSDAAQAFARAFSGQRVQFPSRYCLEADHPISRVLGHDVAARVLKAMFPSGNGAELSVPAGSVSATKETRAELMRGIEIGILNGWTTRRIARNCRCSPRTVFNYRNRLAETGQHPSRGEPQHG